MKRTPEQILKARNAELERELEIEAALERVRAKTMAMHNSEDIADAMITLFDELVKLGVDKSVRCGVNIFDNARVMGELWTVSYDSNGNAALTKGRVDMTIHPLLRRIYKAWKNKEQNDSYELAGADLKNYYKALIAAPDYPFIHKLSELPRKQVSSAFFFPEGALFAFTVEPLSDDAVKLFKRFAGVFGLTYRRYLDLQKAEQQTRQAQIEVAMEKVRSRSLAMQKPEELVEVAQVLRQEMALLGVEELETSSIYIHHEETGKTECWYAIKDQHKLVADHMDMNLKDTWAGKQMLKFYHSDKTQISIPMKGENRKEWINYCSTKSKLLDGYYGDTIPDRTYHLCKFSGGYMGAATPGDISAESWELLQRATAVFSFAYTRFSDLQQAEAQAREARIEAALERVRSRTMGMQHSEELRDVIQVIYEQLHHLHLRNLTAGFLMDFRKSNDFDVWLADPDQSYPNKVHYPYLDNPIYNQLIEAKENGLDFFENSATFEEKNQFLDHVFKYMPDAPEEKQYIREEAYRSPGYIASIVLMKNVAFFIENFEGIPFLAEENAIMKRFGQVFEQTYTRFKDLEQAEEQARESQIQLALERVRARTMAMQKSEELPETSALLFQQVKELGEVAEQNSIAIVNEEGGFVELSTTVHGSHVLRTLHVPIDDPYVMAKAVAAWKAKSKSLTLEFKGLELKAYNELRNNFLETKINFPEDLWVVHISFFSKGWLSFSFDKKVSDEIIAAQKRFAAVFDQTYTRFLDLQKAEAQIREAQIEAALERVRSKTMAMHSSGDVADTVGTMFNELIKLGVEKMVRCGIGILTHGSPQMEVWTAKLGESEKAELVIGHFDMGIHPMLKGIYDAWEHKEPSFSYVLEGDDMVNYFEAINNEPDYPMKYDISKLPSQQFHNDFFFAEGVLFAFTSQPLSTEISSIFKRFAGVFGQTYRRYLDLQRAEAQAKEAQIQLALERVRARTMAMQHSEELAETAAVLFQQFYALGVSPDRVFIATFREETSEMECWTTDQQGSQVSNRFVASLKQHSFAKMYKAWKSKEPSFTLVQTGKELKDYICYLRDEIGVPFKKDVKIEQRVQNVGFFSKGLIGMTTPDVQLPEMISLIERFAKVFDLAYTRFNDLKQAEAQVREAQIEAALERVRSKTMAMHNSQHVAETVAAMVDELIKLGVDKSVRSGIGIISENKQMQVLTAYAGPVADKIDLVIGHLDMTTHQMLSDVFDNWKKKKEHSTYMLTGDDQVNYYKVINNADEYSFKFDIASLPERQFQNAFYFREGFIYVFTHEQLTAEEVQIYKRFAGVFGLTYRRYLDLLNAEEQARESKIEAALEKVRGKALAMYSSADLTSTASMVFTELRKLGINPIRCGVGMVSNKSRKVALYSATTSAVGDSLGLVGWVMLAGHPILDKIYDSLLTGEDYFPVLKGKQLKAYYGKLLSGLSLPGLPDFHAGEEQYGHFFPFVDGCLYAWSDRRYNDTEIRIFRRFASVIDLTFRRYVELQKSEASAREAVRAASLDRVRAEIASMRKHSDLERITPLIWDELTVLGVPFIRCGVFIMDEEQKLIHTFLSTPDGRAIGAFHIPFDTSGNFEIMVDSWRNEVPYIDHWKEEAFSQFADALVKQGAISSKAQYMRTLPHDGVYLNFLPFLQGMLYVGDVSPLAEDNINLIQAVADAFSTAYARYEDFNKLEAAKQQVDNTLADLKATQTKLIQSEKMASLGELTAGIAHEIQNPLNFVNNFSEVNQEMIEELEEELKAGNIDEALALASDIRENEVKINHHGKRADGIVKGMLQHSRTGGGEKQPTNINALADEFMRLSYHGLRAKDKVFNAELITQFDPDLPRISVIGQDIGRVLLNLFNNAFYAVNQKKKTGAADYKPEVSVSTGVENGQVIVKVKDNGMGMTEHVKEKIMQPFFTTKPTGEGTGLGLSLTYDMVVKGHGGTIQVNSVESEGSEFIIQLPIN